MKKERRKVREYGSGELIQMALQSAKNGELGITTFKEVNNVDFTFMQLCSRLNKRKIAGRRVLNNYEYAVIKEGCLKSEIVHIFNDVRARFDEHIFDQRDEV